ncbi:uncharacterized protein J8A68_005415 [[Candida] subhashii]|uniref:Peptidase M20 dimerisation domain-containing protein n=1 Tax=[Candida] subhashii TaxID=561895 RepID=A0A8J5QHK8_9ASCO|nr:uncharacterized protein J8A68_005415 [[Candida] subhashii]KAG7661043.1 hypothetical protein J8A68_005415 [[Candida] subhashii]
MRNQFTKKVIHEAECVIPHTRGTLPINTTASNDNLVYSPRAGSPMRIASPNGNGKQSPSPKISNMHLHVESDIDSVISSNQADNTLSSEYSTGEFDSTKLIHKWTHTLSILCCVASPSRKLLFCGTQDGKILIYDLLTYSLKKEILSCGQHQSASLLTIALSKDENHLFVAGSDSLVKVYDLSNDEFHCTHIIYTLVDIGDIFSIAWCDELSTLFIGAQNASISWCKLSLTSNSHPHTKSSSNSNIERLPHFRYDKFFDSKGPGGSQNTLQTKHELYRRSSKNETSPRPIKLTEVRNEDTIRFAHNGYVYCMEITKASIGDFTERKVLISCGGDGVINIWALESESLTKLTSLQNDESISSMTIHQSLLYVGMGNGNVNVWDLTTLQLIRSFQFGELLPGKNNIRDQSFHEVLSLQISGDSLFKACSNAGLIKITMKSNNVVAQDSVLMSVKEEDGIINTIKTFKIDGRSYLLSGGNKSLCFWDITVERDLSKDEDSLIDDVSDKFSNNKLLSSLKKYISYKTISKKPELYLEDSRHCAQFLSKLLLDLGAYQAKLLPVENANPIVFAVFRKNDNSSTEKKRLLWYAHYDVVDATDHEVNDWETEPFIMTARDGNLYARGVSDNKGPTLASIYAVAELYHMQELSCDVVFIVEGEEECGSIGFQQVINEHKSLIGDIDWIMLSNSYWLDDNTPCLNYGLRGVINASVVIRSDKPDRHSGVDGGVSREPVMDLMHVLGQLMDPATNRIQLANFYDDILPMTKEESKLYENLQTYIDTDICTLMKKWREPSLTIHKIQVSGPNNNTVIPQSVEATISIRIVPNQDLATIKTKLIEKLTETFNQLRSENHLSVNIFHEAEPWLGDNKNKVYSMLYEKVKTHWNQEPLFIREGGSIPSVRFLEKCFDAPAAQVPCGQSSDNAHLNDEKLRIINLYKLRSILTDTFKELGN